MANIEYKISVDKSEIAVDSSAAIKTFTVYVDGYDDVNSFFYETDAEWITVLRNRNDLEVHIDENTLPYIESDEENQSRTASILCTHNCDSEVTCSIIITQSNVKYGVSIDPIEDTYKLYTEATKQYNISVSGGSEIFYVKSVKQYTGKTVNYTDSEGNTVTYDEETDYNNGLIVKADNENQQLMVTSYGRTYVDVDNFYIITLAHKDYREATCTLKISYETIEQEIHLSNTALEFDYLGVAASTNSVEISFGDECPDYGYSYELVDSSVDWLTINENPTSLQFICSVNSGEERSCEVLIHSTDDENKNAVVEVIQDVVPDDITIDRSTFYYSYDEYGEEYLNTTVIRVYGVKGKRQSLSFEGGDGFVITNEKTEKTLFDEYNVSFYPFSKNNSTDREYTETYSGLRVIQSSKANSTPIEYDRQEGNTVYFKVDPSDSVIVVSVSAKWCNPSINQSTKSITIDCDDNPWVIARKCYVTVTNSEDTSMSCKLLITQAAGGTSFSISTT